SFVLTQRAVEVESHRRRRQNRQDGNHTLQSHALHSGSPLHTNASSIADDAPQLPGLLARVHGCCRVSPSERAWYFESQRVRSQRGRLRREETPARQLARGPDLQLFEVCLTVEAPSLLQAFPHGPETARECLFDTIEDWTTAGDRSAQYFGKVEFNKPHAR